MTGAAAHVINTANARGEYLNLELVIMRLVGCDTIFSLMRRSRDQLPGKEIAIHVSGLTFPHNQRLRYALAGAASARTRERSGPGVSAKPTR
ncbi:MAG: hypothetical protein ACOH1R_10530 [Luteimonas sp.]